MRKENLKGKNLGPNFIGSWFIEPDSLCGDLIEYFELNEKQQGPGETARGVNLASKDSTDISISPLDLRKPKYKIFCEYFDSLFRCYEDYVEQWPFLSSFADHLQIGSFNLQRYRVGQHFQQEHAERTSLSTLQRVFAFMTYLNDLEVDAGGSTSFTHYDLDIQPQRGLTLIWPAEWTHAHKGNPILSGSKYIITGWLHFPVSQSVIASTNAEQTAPQKGQKNNFKIVS